jgi:hypothetical protein
VPPRDACDHDHPPGDPRHSTWDPVG